MTIAIRAGDISTSLWSTFWRELIARMAVEAVAAAPADRGAVAVC